MWEKEKLLVTLQAISPFPTVFSGNLYCKHLKSKGLFCKRLICYLQMLLTTTKLCHVHERSDFGQHCLQKAPDVTYYLLTHYQTTNLDSSKLKKFANNNFKFDENGGELSTGRKHCGKRRNCSLRAISPFPTVFSKGLFPRDIKRCRCVGMG